MANDNIADFDDRQATDPFDAGPDVTQGDDAMKLLKTRAVAAPATAPAAPSTTDNSTPASGPISAALSASANSDANGPASTTSSAANGAQAGVTRGLTPQSADAVYSDGAMNPDVRTSPTFLRTLNASSEPSSTPYYGPEGAVMSGVLGRGGLDGTLSLEQGAAMRGLNSPSPPQGYDPTEAARNYRTDIAAILNKDPRSTLGGAAWNAYADRVWDRNVGPQSGRAGIANRQLADAVYQQKINALSGVPQNEFTAQNQAGNDFQRNLTTAFDAAGRNAAAMAAARMKADSTVDTAGIKATSANQVADTKADSYKYSADQRLTGTQATADARTKAAQISAERQRVDAAADATFSRAYQSALARGMPPDQARAEASQAQSALLNQRATRLQGTTTGKSPISRIPQGAIDLLKKNPDKRADFDAMFGVGASRQYLGD
jgi:hypothetical protein